VVIPSLNTSFTLDSYTFVSPINSPLMRRGKGITVCYDYATHVSQTTGVQ